MDRREYLVKTFSRTYRKDYENHILTAIWHRIDNLNLKPVSQQYVKREYSYALMDLYFPQIRVGIEVDEAFHKNYQSQDELRMDDILSAVKEDELEDFLVLRIDATLPIEQMHERINEVVEIIKERSETWPLQWLLYEEELEECRKQSHLSIYDNISFKDIKDIANTVFGKNAKRYQRSYFRIGPQLWLWCPKLSIVEEGNRRSAAAGWLNILADDWSYIDESHEDDQIVAARKEMYYTEIDHDQKRAVFAKYKDNLGVHCYRFVGVFKIAGVSPENSRFIRYERTNERVEVVRSGN